MQDLLKQLIHKCSKGERHSQKELYVMFAPKMFAVCLRYSKNREDAEEILQEGFMKVFDNLTQFQFNGSFEGWVRKIMVNCALQKYRSKSQLHAVLNIDDVKLEQGAMENTTAQLGAKELLS